MLDHVTRVLNRARYAATGAAIGAFVGGLVSRNAASTGAALGALVGATIGERRQDVDAIREHVDDLTDRGLRSESESDAR
ncbi:glycine zipper 2TM domain-containing protein [Halosolutus gelatinilyticus]|uniref:glycine zipper 2TM domain-containing protein n=1 Tax=Halosolutus gelatinilyticus TaxID=2931975 RepID=UPI001FF21ED4|nr:glycine zipper 2TM domain-containing protein [Halosolutus gelatinilyticus]